MTAGLDIATAALRRAKAMKEDLVKREGVGSDLQPFLELWVEGKPWMTVWMNGDGVDHAPVVAGALAFSRCDLAVVVTEAYTITSDSPGDDLRRGELAERFAAGDPTVAEGLLVGMFPRDEPAALWSAPYRYDGRTPVWLGQDRSGDDLDGRLVDAARGGYQHRVAEDHLMDHAELARNLMTLPGVSKVGLWVERAPAPPRNAPCPCGSGRKAKHCDHGRN